MRKRILSVAMVMVMTLQAFLVFSVEEAEAAVKTYANVVLFVQFQDSSADAKQNYVIERTNAIKKCWDDDGLSVRNYLHAVSYGKAEVKNYFPQQDGNGEIVPYTLSQPASAYTTNINVGEPQMIAEVARLYQQSGASMPLDCVSQEGFLDNLTIVLDDGAESFPKGQVSNHHSSYAGKGTIAGKKIGDYNILLGSGCISSGDLWNSGVPTHEFLHSLGYKDLYRSTESGKPVDQWDIMASAGYLPSYPLAYFRSSVSGWISIPELREDKKRCTLYAPLTGRDHPDEQALILRTPYSEQEFFVVEYRKQGQRYQNNLITDDLDQRIPGSGLIIYRINTNKISNTQGGTDMAYVFRPNDVMESGVEAGQGDLTASFLSAESGRTAYGNSDPAKGLSDNAITYSDGTNSGIVISNVGQAGDTISFDVTFHQASADQLWETTLSSNAVSGIQKADCALDEANGDIYSIQKNDYAYYLYKRSGSAWQRLDYSGLSGNTYSCRLGAYKGEVYAAYAMSAGGSIQAKMARWNGNSWQELGTLSTNANEVSLSVNASGVYAAVTDGDNNQQLKIYQYAGTTLSQLGKGSIGGNTYHANICVSADRGQILAFYRDFTDNSALRCYIYQSRDASWRLLGQTVLTGDCCTAKVYNGKAYLVRNTNGGDKEVWTCDANAFGADWTRLGGESYSGNRSAVLDADIAFSGSDVYVLYSMNESVCVSAFRNGTWQAEGSKIASGADGPEIFAASTNLYVTYLGGIGGKCTIRRRTIPASVRPDVNTGTEDVPGNAASVPTAKAVRVIGTNDVNGDFALQAEGVRAAVGIAKVQIAVWSQANQSDLHWYTAQRQNDGIYVVGGNIAMHKGHYGEYQAHVYVTDKTGITGFFGGTSFTVKAPSQRTVAAVTPDQSTVYIEVDTSAVYGGQAVRDIRCAVWSDANGQDDLVWYQAYKESNAVWRSMANTKNHRTAGRYSVHTYGTLANGRSVCLSTTSFTIKEPSGSGLTLIGTNEPNGDFALRLNRTSSDVNSVSVAVWSRADQSDLHWYTAWKEGNSYVLGGNIAYHKYGYGTYQAHAYVTNKAGITAFGGGMTFRLKAPDQSTVAAVTPDQSTAYIEVNTSAVYGGQAIRDIRCAVWSDANGQDDLVWYQAYKESNAVWRSMANTKNHRTAGQYSVHTYGTLANGRTVFLSGTTFTVGP